MITFYPRDINMWRTCPEFDLSQRDNILLLPLQKTHYKTFHDRPELIEFLKQYGVRLDDPTLPLKFVGPEEHFRFGNVYTVVQWSLVGWMKDDLT